MTALRYSRRPHRAAHVSYEYRRAERDWTIWRHVAYFVALITLLVLAITWAGGALVLGVPQ